MARVRCFDGEIFAFAMGLGEQGLPQRLVDFHPPRCGDELWGTIRFLRVDPYDFGGTTVVQGSWDIPYVTPLGATAQASPLVRKDICRRERLVALRWVADAALRPVAVVAKFEPAAGGYSLRYCWGAVSGEGKKSYTS